MIGGGGLGSASHQTSVAEKSDEAMPTDGVSWSVDCDGDDNDNIVAVVVALLRLLSPARDDEYGGEHGVGDVNDDYDRFADVDDDDDDERERDYGFVLYWQPSDVVGSNH